MSYTNVYPSRINWENEPSIASPINATNLNKIDYAVYQHDRTLETWDTTKANQSDLLLSVKSIDYDDETGVFIFTWQNGTTKTVDLNIEKIPVSFSMSPLGVITMTTEDGTTYTADVGALIKTYTFTDSERIDFTVTTDLSGNKTVTADIVDGSITGAKLQPDYLADCQSAATSASNSATTAGNKAQDSEAWAVGERGGVPVQSSDPAYNNNAKYWAQHTSASFAGLSDTDINSPQDGQVPVYNSTSQKWENADQSAGGGSTIIVGTNEVTLRGQTCTITDGVTTLTETINNSGVATFKGVTLTGTLTISATDGVDTAQRTIDVPYFGNYTATLSFFSATITVTYPASGTCTITDGSTTLTATSNPMAFVVPNTGTWTAKATVDGIEKSGTPISITTDGQTASDTIVFGTINLSFDDAFRGSTITCASGGTTISKTAPISGNTMAFYPPSTGTWSVSGTYSGQTYSKEAVVTDLSVPVSVQLQTTQTVSVTIYSAVGDTITYTDIYSVSRMITLDADSDHATASIDILPSGSTLTFTSSVAKNPDDLSSAYSKSVTITGSTSEIYVMPDATKTLYWWGYQSGNCETVSTANGWSKNTYVFDSPTYNKNEVVLTAAAYGASGHTSAIASKNSVSASKCICINQGVTAYSSYGYGFAGMATSKSLSTATTETERFMSSNISKVEKSFTQGNYYIHATSENGQSAKVYALWYE